MKKRLHTLTIPPAECLSVAPDDIVPCRVFDTEIVAAETPYLLFHDERLNMRSAEGGVETYWWVEWLKVDVVMRGLTKKTHCV